MLKDIITKLKYGCDSADEYNFIRDMIYERNHKNWRLLTGCFFVYFIVLLFASVLFDHLHSNMILYGVFSVLMGIGFLLLNTICKPGNKSLMPCIYILCSVLLAFGIILGAIISPQYLSVTYHVLIISLPLVLIGRPYKLCVIELIAGVLFCVITIFTKEYDLVFLDLTNAISFGLIAQFVIYMLTTTRIRQLINERKLEISNTRDELTGLFNRKAYEADIHEIDQEESKSGLVYIAMDVNNLKRINDTLGHNAGDELIIAAASCLKKVFSDYGRLYRMGGDEFVALLQVDEDKLAELNSEFENAINSWTGAHVKQLAISCGYVLGKEMPKSSMHDISIVADKRMYKNKYEYYQSKGQDRRSSR